MSCNIFDAWECPASFTMAEAVVLAKEAADIQHASARNEIVDSFDGINWMPWYDYIVETFGDNSGQLGRIVAAGIFPVMQSHYLSLVNVFPTSCESELDATLRRLTGSMSIANRGDTLDAMHSFCKDLYEAFMKYDASLLFLTDNAGRMYVKGSCLTQASSAFLSSKLTPFVYTDATEMREEDFPELAEAFTACKGNEHREELLASAQKNRGKKWDELLCGQTNFNGLGLTYSMNDMSRTAKYVEITSVVRDIISHHEK